MSDPDALEYLLHSMRQRRATLRLDCEGDGCTVELRKGAKWVVRGHAATFAEAVEQVKAMLEQSE